MRPVRVLVAGNDWGGLNLLIPLLRAWIDEPRISAEFIGGPAARRSMAAAIDGLCFAPNVNELNDYVCHRRNELDHHLARILGDGSYDAILCTTSSHALIERALLRLARQAGIPSVAFCDMWCAYAERFYDGKDWTLPNRLWVIDEIMRTGAAATAWPSTLPIDVIGSPLFGDLARRGAECGIKRGRTIRYISEHVSAEYPNSKIDEFELADMVVAGVHRAGLDAPIVIRPHPAEAQEQWRRWTYLRRNDGVAFETLPIEAAIIDTGMAVGITSMLLAEMRMFGVPSASLHPSGVDERYYCLPFEALGIAQIADADGLAQWLKMPKQVAAPETGKVHLAAVDTATRAVLDLVGYVSNGQSQ